MKTGWNIWCETKYIFYAFGSTDCSSRKGCTVPRFSLPISISAVDLVESDRTAFYTVVFLGSWLFLRDQITQKYSVKGTIQKWTLALFYNLLDLWRNKCPHSLQRWTEAQTAERGFRSSCRGMPRSLWMETDSISWHKMDCSTIQSCSRLLKGGGARYREAGEKTLDTAACEETSTVLNATCK